MERHERTPTPSREQESPEPERLVTPEEEAGMDLQNLDNPPQAEGDRDLEEDREREGGRRAGGSGNA